MSKHNISLPKEGVEEVEEEIEVMELGEKGGGDEKKGEAGSDTNTNTDSQHFLERGVAAATATWLSGLPSIKNFEQFVPISSEVTSDTTALAPSGSFVHSTIREHLHNLQDIDSRLCSRKFLPSLRAAAEIQNSIAQFQTKIFSILARYNLTAIMVPNRNEYGGRRLKESRLRAVVRDSKRVQGAMAELDTLKVGAGQFFIRAVTDDRSPVSVCFSSWAAGLAGAVQMILRRVVDRYSGSHSKMTLAGMHLPSMVSGTKRLNSVHPSRESFIAGVNEKLSGDTTLDTSSSIFNNAIKRAYSEFLVTVDSASTDVSSPYRNVLRQARYDPSIQSTLNIKTDPSLDIGMLIPRPSMANIVTTNRSHQRSKEEILSQQDHIVEDVSRTFQQHLQDKGRKRHIPLPEDGSLELLTAATIDQREWTHHITQLFSQAFLETMTSVLALSFEQDDPFSSVGFDAIKKRVIPVAASNTSRRVALNMHTLVEKHLLAAGNLFINFVVAPTDDIIEGRPVALNIPVLAVVTKTEDTTHVHLTDRLLVHDKQVGDALRSQNNSRVSSRDTTVAEDKPEGPRLVGCLPIIHTLTSDDTFHYETSSLFQSLAADWFHALTSLGATGKIGATIAVGVLDALTKPKLVDKDGKVIPESDKQKRQTNHRSLRHSMELMNLMNQSLASWGHSGHNANLTSYWSGASAIRSLAAQRSMSRQLTVHPESLDETESTIRRQLLSSMLEANTFNPLDGLPLNMESDESEQNTLVRMLTSLPRAVSEVLNVSGFMEVLRRFSLPLGKDHYSVKRNLRAVDHLMSALGNMTLQSVVNAMDEDGDPWHGVNTAPSFVVEPNRMRALTRLSSSYRRHNLSHCLASERSTNVMIPICRTRGAVAGLLSGFGQKGNVVLPVALFSKLISSKITLDRRCRLSGQGAKLNDSILDFVKRAAGWRPRQHQKDNSVYLGFSKDDYVMLLSYLWFNTAIISLTDTNAIAVIDTFSPGLGQSIYSDFVAVRSMIDNYYRNQTEYSVRSLVERHTKMKSEKTSIGGIVKSLSPEEINHVLDQLATNLTAFTTYRETDIDNENRTVSSFKDVNQVSRLPVTIKPTQYKKMSGFVECLRSVVDAALKFRPFIKIHRAFGEKSPTDSFKPLSIEDMVTSSISATAGGIPTRGPVGHRRTIDIRARDPVLLAAIRADNQAKAASAAVAAAKAVSSGGDIDEAQRKADNAAAVAAADPDPPKHTLIIPDHMSVASLMNIVKQIHPEMPGLDLLALAVTDLYELLVPSASTEIIKRELSEVPSLVQTLILVGMWMCEAMAGHPDILTDGVTAMADLSVGLLAEATLVVSRLQKTYCPIPPAAFGMTGVLHPNSETFAKMSQSFLATTIDKLVAGQHHHHGLRDNDSSTAETIGLIALKYNKQIRGNDTIAASGTESNGGDNAAAVPPTTSTGTIDDVQAVARGVSIVPQMDIDMKEHLMNPIDVFSEKALPHFDLVVCPFQKRNPLLNPDMTRRLSSLHQGMITLPQEIRTDDWDSILAGNTAGYTLPHYAATSFNSALDSIMANPSQTAAMVAREIVNYATAIVGQRRDIAERLEECLSKGKNVLSVPIFPNSTTASQEADPVLLRAIKESIFIMTKPPKNPLTSIGSGSMDYNLTPSAILDGWTGLSVLTWPDQRVLSSGLSEPVVFSRSDDLSVKSDVVRQHLTSIPAFRERLVSATRSIFELCVVTSILSSDERARRAARTVLMRISERSPVLSDIKIGQMANLVSTLASPKRYKSFLKIVSNERVRIAHLTGSSSTYDSHLQSEGLEDPLYAEIYGSRSGKEGSIRGSADNFWMGVFDHSLPIAHDDDFGDRDDHGIDFASDKGQLFPSVVNTYASLSSEAIRDGSGKRTAKYNQAIRNIAKYVKGLVKTDSEGMPKDTTLDRLAAAQRCYSQISTAMTNAAFGCRSSSTYAVDTHEPDETLRARREADSVLAALLRNMAPRVLEGGTYTPPGNSHIVPETTVRATARAMSTVSHVLMGKIILPSLSTQSPFAYAYRTFLAAAGVTGHNDLVAAAIFDRLTSNDLALFLGGSLLQRGLFISFFLNSVLFGRIGKEISVNNLSSKARCQLTKVVDFCVALRHLFSSNNRDTHGYSVSDKSIAAAVSKVYGTLRTLRRTASITPFQTNLPQSLTTADRKHGPRVKRSSTLSDVLKGGSVIHPALLSNYSEKTIRSRLSKVIHRHGQQARRRAQESSLLECMDYELLSSRQRHQQRGEKGTASAPGEYISTLDNQHYGYCNVYADDEFGNCNNYDSDTDEDMDDSENLTSSSDSGTDSSSDEWSDFHSDDDDFDGDFRYDPLRHMSNRGHRGSDSDTGRTESDDESLDSDDNNCQSMTINRRQRKANRAIYGPGFLTSSLETGSSRQALVDHLRRMGGYIDPGEEEEEEEELIGSSSSEEEDDDKANVSGKSTKGDKHLTRRQHKERLARVLREFAPKDITIRNGEITNVVLVDSSKLVSLMSEYESTSSASERKRIRIDNDMVDADEKAGGSGDGDGVLPKAYLSRRIQKPRHLRAALVRNTAHVMRTLEANLNIVHQSLYNSGPSAMDQETVIEERVLSANDLNAIIANRDRLVYDVSQTAPTLFGSYDLKPEVRTSAGAAGGDAPPGLPMESVIDARKVMHPDTTGYGYLAVPIKTVNNALPSASSLSYLDLVTVTALALARSFRVTTGFAVEELVRSRNSLDEMRGALETLITSPEGTRVKVKSTLLNDIVSTRMAHVDSLLGLTSPVVFINQALPEGPERRQNESQILIVIRGVNSEQLVPEAVSSTTDLLEFLTSSKRMGTLAPQTSLSLYHMSVVDNLLGLSTNRLKGAVSLEVGGGVLETCTDDIFSRRSVKLLEYCRKVGFKAEMSVGPIKRFLPTGTIPDVTISVVNDPAYHHLLQADAPDASGASITMSAVGNLYGMIDTISCMAARCVEAVQAISSREDNNGSKEDNDDATDPKSVIKDLKRRMKSMTKTSLKLSSSSSGREDICGSTLAPRNRIPVFSNTILDAAYAIRSSIATIIGDVRTQFGVPRFSGPSQKARVTLQQFEQLVESLTAIGHHRAHIHSIANRLAAAHGELEKVQCMRRMGLSESLGAFVAVATTMAPYRAYGGKPNNASVWLKDMDLIGSLTGRELHNIRKARQIVDKSMISLDLMADHLDTLVATCSAETELSTAKRSKCGDYLIHPETQVLVCLAPSKSREGPGTESIAFNSGDQQTMERELAWNRTAMARVQLAALRFGRPEIGSIFSIDEGDKKPLDTVIASLSESLARPSSQRKSVVPTVNGPSSQRAAETIAASLAASGAGLTEAATIAGAAASEVTSLSKMTKAALPVAKSMAYIPVVYDNWQHINKMAAVRSLASSTATANCAGHRLVRASESRDLAAILQAHSRHKYGSYNQAAIVSMFCGTSSPVVLTIPLSSSSPEASSSDVATPPGLLAGLGVTKISSLQLPPTSGDAAATSSEKDDDRVSTGSTKAETLEFRLQSLVQKLSERGRLNKFDEYQRLQRVREQVNRALHIQSEIKASVDSGGLVKGGEAPILSDDVRSNLSNMLTAKRMAISDFEKLIDDLSKNSAPSSEANNNLSGSSGIGPLKLLTGRLQSTKDIGESDERIVQLAENTPQLRVFLLLLDHTFSRQLRSIITDLGEYYKTMSSLSVDTVTAVNRTREMAEIEARRSIDLDANKIVPAFEDAKILFQRELDAIHSARTEVLTKTTELNGLATTIRDSVAEVTDRINTGIVTFDVPEFLSLGSKYDSENIVKDQLMEFAKRNSGSAFDVLSDDIASAAMTTRTPVGSEGNQETGNALISAVVKTIASGQEIVHVDYGSAIDQYPNNIVLPNTADQYRLVDHQKREQDRLLSVTKFLDVLARRAELLSQRADVIANDIEELEDRRRRSIEIYNKQLETRLHDLEQNIGIIITTLKTHIGNDLAQSTSLVSLGAEVDRLLHRIYRDNDGSIDTQGRVYEIRRALENVLSAPNADSGIGGAGNSDVKMIEETVTAARVNAATDSSTDTPKIEASTETVISESVAPFNCFLRPLHTALAQLESMFITSGGALSRPVPNDDARPDLQMMTIKDLCSSVLSAQGSKEPESTASAIVRGICESCAMMIFNLHTPIHASDHEFEFDGLQSRERLQRLLKAALNTASESLLDNQDAVVRERILSFMEGNNGSVKNLKFTVKQRVACLTPVNTSMGRIPSIVWPNTVIIPTSELFDCPGLAYDKFRSMASRSWDPVVANAAKEARSIVGTLARTTPAAEALYFPSKDERRFFNSICDGILKGMGPKASSVFNTTCDQNLARRDPVTGLPVFVGRLGNRLGTPSPDTSQDTVAVDSSVSRTDSIANTTTSSPHIDTSTNGNSTGINNSSNANTHNTSDKTKSMSAVFALQYQQLDMEASFMVAPGANLNRHKEERLRIYNLTDLNNVRHLDTDINLAASSITSRILEVVHSAVGDDDAICSDVTKSLLLGSVATLVAEKTCTRQNDPSNLIESYNSARNIVERTIGTSGDWCRGTNAEDMFGLQVAYRHRLFPACGVSHTNTRAMEKIKTIGAEEFLSCYPRYRAARACLTKANPNTHCPIVADRFEENPQLLHEVRGLLSENTRARIGLGADRLSGAIATLQNQVAEEWKGYRHGHGLVALRKVVSAPNVDQGDQSNAAANLAVGVMADSIVDTLSVMSAAAGRQRAPPPVASLNRSTIKKLSTEVENIASESPGLERLTSAGTSALSAILAGGTGTGQTSTSLSSERDANTAAVQRIFGNIFSNLEEASRRLTALVGSGRRRYDEVRQLSDNATSLALRLSEEAAGRDVFSVREDIDRHLMRESLSEVKRAVGSGFLRGKGSSLHGSASLSSLLDRNEVASGRLCASSISSGRRIAAGIDEFNASTLISRYVALDPEWSPIPMLSRETRQLLQRPEAITARALLSEESKLLTELVLYNTRDTPLERAVDRILLQPYLVQHAKRFDSVDPTFPLALTGSTHCMLSAMDVRNHPRSLLANLNLHVTDTTSFFKNLERFEKLTGRHGDTYEMTHHQNCNCPFELHHDFRPSVDEHLVPSFAYSRPEVTLDDVQDKPYQAQNMLNDKHYLMAITKVDPTISGAAILRRVSEWSEMGVGSRYVGTYEPTRAALAASTFKTSGVNIDIIVRPDNARGVLGILGCHRRHVCALTAKLCATTSMPSAFRMVRTPTTNTENEFASDMLQMALPHNVYIQKNKMNAASSSFCNVLEQLTDHLGREILADLSEALLVGDTSVPSSIGAEAAAALSSLSGIIERPDKSKSNNDSSVTSTSTTSNATSVGHFQLINSAMRQTVCRSLRNRLVSDINRMPFSDHSTTALAYDFLTADGYTTDEKIDRIDNQLLGAIDCGSRGNNKNGHSVESKTLLNQLSVIFTAISQEVSDAQFTAILDNLEARIVNNNYHKQTGKSVTDHTARGALADTINTELSRVIAFMRILKSNVVPNLTSNILKRKVALYLSLLSGRSRLENLFKFGLSNSGSIDLSHLQPLTKSVHIEDTILYSRVHPLLAMALPANCSALLQQEQNDPTLCIRQRKPLASFLNHPNTKHMTRSARAVIGAGGGHAMGLLPSSLVLHEMTISTTDGAVDTISREQFHSLGSRDPLVVITPFKEGSGLELPKMNSAPIIMQSAGGVQRTPCSYLQVSMPTQFSGVVTNTGVVPLSAPQTFEYTRRDGTRLNLKRLQPAVLCSDAVTNVLDAVSRADLTLKGISVRFGYMPELISAIAAVQKRSTQAVIDSMVAAAASTPSSSIDPVNGDIVVTGGVFPTPESLTPRRFIKDSEGQQYINNRPSAWGINGKLQARLLPRMFVDNPLSMASVNGVPLTDQGRQLSMEKGRTLAFDGILSVGGILKSADDERLAPLRASWNQLVNLRNKLSAAGSTIRDQLATSVGIKDAEATISKLYNQFRILEKGLDVIAQEAAKTIAVSDMLLGGSGGDPSTALMCPVNPESLGILGAIGSLVRTGTSLFAESRTRGITALHNTFRNKLVLNSAGGRVLAEHGLIYGLGEELIGDSDSIAGKLARNVGQGEDGTSSDRSRWRLATIHKILPPPSMGTASFVSRSIAGSNLTGYDMKRNAIEKLLLSREDILNNVVRAMASVGGVTTSLPSVTLMATLPDISNCDARDLNKMLFDQS
nr:MAG: wsv360-like protein [Penaeus semisulcatus pemonivirus]